MTKEYKLKRIKNAGYNIIQKGRYIIAAGKRGSLVGYISSVYKDVFGYY